MPRDALRLLDEAGQPRTVEGAVVACRWLLERQRYDDVLAVADQTPPVPIGAEVFEAAATAALALGRAADAIGAARLALECGGASARRLLQLADAYELAGDPDLQRLVRQRVLTRPDGPPELARAHPELVTRALAHEILDQEIGRVRDTSGAGPALERLDASGDASSSPVLIRRRGLLLAELKRHQEAIDWLGTAARVFPDDHPLTAEMVWNLLDAGQVQSALGCLSLIRPERLPGTTGWTLLEAAHRQAGRLQDALGSVERGLEAIPGDRELRGRRALLLYETGSSEAAEAEARAVLTAGPQPEALATRGYVRRDAGDSEAAAEAFARAWAARPDRILWAHDGASAALAAGQVDRARSLYRDAAAHAPEEDLPQLGLVRLELRHGRIEDAEAAARAFVAAAPESSEAWAALATVLAAEGDTAAAIEAARAGLRHPPPSENLRRVAAKLGLALG